MLLIILYWKILSIFINHITIAAIPLYIIATILGKSFFLIAYRQCCIIVYFGLPNLTFDVILINLPNIFNESDKFVVLRFFFYIYNIMPAFCVIISLQDRRKLFKLPTAKALYPLTKRNLILLTAYAIYELIDTLVCESLSILPRTYFNFIFYLGNNN